MSNVKAILRAITAEIGRDEALILVGLACLTYGLWSVARPAAFVVTGALLIWIALPSRRPFITSQPAAPKKEHA